MLKEFTNLINAWTTNIHTLSLTLGQKFKKNHQLVLEYN